MDRTIWMLIILVAGLCGAGVLAWREIDGAARGAQAISTQWVLGAYLGEGEEDPSIDCVWWTNRKDDPIVVRMLRYTFISPTPPIYTSQYTYDADKGGRLVLNGQLVDANDRPQIWVNGPYGKLVRMSLDPEDRQRLFRIIAGAKGKPEELRDFWDEVIAERLYRVEGQRKDGKKAGVWTTWLVDGTKYSKGSYVEGKRDGEWVIWYPDGKVQSRTHYAKGKRHGLWTVYDPSGKTTFEIEWKNDRPVGHSVTFTGPRSTVTLNPDGSGSGCSSFLDQPESLPAYHPA